MPNSSHGKTPSEAITYLLELAPQASAIRTHALVQSTPALYEIFKSCPQLKYDLSVLMYPFPHIGKFPWKYDGVEFERINYNGEDDCAFFDKGFSWKTIDPTINTMIYDFHPIHVALNSSSLKPYQELKKALGDKPLTEATRADLTPFVNKEPGTRDLLACIVQESRNLLSFEELLQALA